MNTKNKLTHFNKEGNAIMVDVSQKKITGREALASGKIFVSREVMEAIRGGGSNKGDVLGVARVAGMMAVKQTSTLIPMCHPLPIDRCGIEFICDENENTVTASCTVKMEGKTGVEMEALTGVSVALLTVYDMCKAIDKRMIISDIRLIKKTGGKSGEFYA
ncbi:MAG: cyclic pyranopterin monophosphate synthase MoaC [Lachnospiraceae bacterium]